MRLQKWRERLVGPAACVVPHIQQSSFVHIVRQSMLLVHSADRKSVTWKTIATFMVTVLSLAVEIPQSQMQQIQFRIGWPLSPAHIKFPSQCPFTLRAQSHCDSRFSINTITFQFNYIHVPLAVGRSSKSSQQCSLLIGYGGDSGSGGHSRIHKWMHCRHSIVPTNKNQQNK